MTTYNITIESNIIGTTYHTIAAETEAAALAIAENCVAVAESVHELHSDLPPIICPRCKKGYLDSRGTCFYCD